MVRVKFCLTEVHQMRHGTRYIFSPFQEPSIPEAQRASVQSPVGRLELLIDNPAVVDQFNIGEFFCVDVGKFGVPADPPAAAPPASSPPSASADANAARGNGGS